MPFESSAVRAAIVRYVESASVALPRASSPQLCQHKEFTEFGDAEYRPPRHSPEEKSMRSAPVMFDDSMLYIAQSAKLCSRREELYRVGAYTVSSHFATAALSMITVILVTEIC